MPIQEHIGSFVRSIRSHGQRSIQDQLAACGLVDCRGAIIVDAAPATLVEKSIDLHEGILTSKGALAVETGRYTGRSPEDRFIVDTPDVHDQIAWGPVNKPFSQENYDLVKEEVIDYLQQRDLFVVRAIGGADRRWFRKSCSRTCRAYHKRKARSR